MLELSIVLFVGNFGLEHGEDWGYTEIKIEKVLKLRGNEKVSPKTLCIIGDKKYSKSTFQHLLDILFLGKMQELTNIYFVSDNECIESDAR